MSAGLAHHMPGRACVRCQRTRVPLDPDAVMCLGCLWGPLPGVPVTTAAGWLDGDPEVFVVGCDIDGVHYRFNERLRAWFIEQCGFAPSRLIDPPTYSIEDAWGITRGELLAELANGVRAGFMFYGGDRFEDGAAGLARVVEAGARVEMVTARNLPGVETACRVATDQWLTEAGLPFHGLHLSHTKNEVAWDVLIDDYEVNVRTALAAGRHAILLDRPWNRPVTDLPLVAWEDIPEVVAQMAAAKRAGCRWQPEGTRAA